MALKIYYEKDAPIDALKGKKVGLICSGGNTSLEHLKLALAI